MHEAALLVNRFFAIAKTCPASPFLEANRALTYGAAAEEVLQRAQQLTKAADSLPVVLQGPNTVEWVLGLLAARAAGLVVVPLPTEVAAERWPLFEQILGSFYLFDAARDSGTIWAGAEPRRPAIPAGVGFCLPTSGSTGEPRFALRSELSLLAEGERYVNSLGFVSTDRMLVVLPLCHAFALGLALGAGVAAGCALQLLPHFTPRTVQHLLAEGRSSILPLVPAAARLLCQTFGVGEGISTGLRHVVIGAGQVTPALERAVVERFGRLPARGYGSSETGATLGTVGQVVPAGVTGAPLPGVEAVIAGDNQIGALFVRTQAPFLGYLLADGVDASRISPDGWYSTGDWASSDDQGWITITGRLGESFRRGGRFIQPAEVQRALLSHPHVVDSLIRGSRDEHGEDVIEAHVEIQAGQQFNAAHLHQYLEQHLEAYKIPTAWYFYDILPRTGSGKPDRARLRQPNAVKPGRSTALFSAVTAHRLSTTVMAAHRLELLAALAESNPRSAAELAADLKLDRQGVEVLLEVLTVAGILDRNPDGAYHAAEPLKGVGLDAVIEFEDYVRTTWLSVEAVEAVVRNGIQNRAFEVDPGPAFLDRYLRVMGGGTKVLAWQAWRQVTLPPGPVLDIGRPAGAWAEVVQQRASDRCIFVLNLPSGRRPFEFELRAEPLAAIFIHNGFRRFVEPDCPLPLEQLCRALHPEGVLIVADIFTDTPDSTPWRRSALRLDWLTHGHLEWPSGANLSAALSGWGFTSIRRIYTDSLFDLFIAQKTGGINV